MQINGVYFLFRLGPLLYFVISGYFQKKNYPTESTHVSSALSFFGDFNGRKSSTGRTLHYDSSIVANFLKDAVF